MGLLSFISLLLLVLMPLEADAQEPTSYLIRSIKTSGLTKTDPKVVKNLLGFKKGDTVNQETIDEGITQIKNTTLFLEVDHQLTPLKKGGYRLIISAKDRWTTIPIAKFSSGGGVSQLILGVFDPNIAGKYLEAGAQYQRLGDTNSGVAWFRNRRLFGQPLFLDIQAWNTNRIRTKFNQEAVEPEIEAGFLHIRRNFYLGLQYEFAWWLKSGVFFEHHSDEFSDDLVSDEVLRKRKTTDIPPKTEFVFSGLNLELGRQNHGDYLSEGLSAKLEYRYGKSQNERAEDFNQADLSLLYQKTLFGDATFAQRIEAGGTNTDTLQYWFYLGGLDKIRGFADNRFAGRFFWLSNTEFRIPTYRNDWFILQNIFFYDSVGVAEDIEDWGEASGSSVGTGIRIIAPKVYRLVFRLDFAQALLRDDDMSVSFGVQQFF